MERISSEAKLVVNSLTARCPYDVRVLEYSSLLSEDVVKHIEHSSTKLERLRKSVDTPESCPLNRLRGVGPKTLDRIIKVAPSLCHCR